MSEFKRSPITHIISSVLSSVQILVYISKPKGWSCSWWRFLLWHAHDTNHATSDKSLFCSRIICILNWRAQHEYNCTYLWMGQEFLWMNKLEICPFFCETCVREVFFPWQKTCHSWLGFRILVSLSTKEICTRHFVCRKSWACPERYETIVWEKTARRNPTNSFIFIVGIILRKHRIFSQNGYLQHVFNWILLEIKFWRSTHITRNFINHIFKK